MADLGSQLLGARTPRKTPGTLSARRSNVSLRQSGSLAQDLGGSDNDGGQRFTLAHELAAALMPDPNSSSRMLADEFGIELEEDGDGEAETTPDDNLQIHVPQHVDNPPELAQAEPLPVKPAPSRGLSSVAGDGPDVAAIRKQSPPPVFEKDPFLVLNQSLKSTDKFINQLRRLDSEPAHTSLASQESSLEELAATIIRKLDETTRAREEQVRELLGYEREFRKIAGEIGGNDLLGDLDELERIDGLIDEQSAPKEPTQTDEELTVPRHTRPVSSAWEDAPDPHSLDALMEEEEEEEEEEEDGYNEPNTPAKDVTFLPPSPPSTGPPTPSSTLPHLAHMRTITQSLVSSLGTISEQAQVNAAATTEAGRKIRMLKNKLGGWKSEWESAERSRIRIEKWEAGIWDDGTDITVLSPTSPRDSSPPDSLPKG
ncbi:SubName: Full=Uncharacterized protein {ECO:0000313/EMBL:CCA72067.1} [Serendipita indica DSM 11827]|nr:SubName: Full=Uncharacterized protein {ECO:0000313/EMBL:CCA72067.1} [Serendipita indica DSM 11827]